MVVAAANLVTKHGIENIDLENDYMEDHNFLHDGTGRRKRRHDDDIISMGHDDADAEGMLKVLLLKIRLLLIAKIFDAIVANWHFLNFLIECIRGKYIRRKLN